MTKFIPKQLPPIDFDLRQLEIFSKVVELGSFSKAADVVFLAQASVSERIATLENMVGAKLLDRLGRQIIPTRAGNAGFPWPKEWGNSYGWEHHSRRVHPAGGYQGIP